MRKLYLLFILAPLGIINSFAQNSKWDIGIEAGAAIPLKNFSRKNIYDSTAAFARIGPAINLSVDYKLSLYFRLLLLLTGEQNNVDTIAMVEQWVAAFPGTYFRITGNNWMMGKVMAGVQTQLPLMSAKNLYFTTRLAAGIVKTANYTSQ